MNTPKQHAIEKLPLWAQRVIGNLEMRLQEACEQIAELTNSESTRVECEPYYSTDGPLSYLPERVRIRFSMTDKAWRDFIDVTLRGDHVEIHGSDTLEIAPYSSNIIHLRLRKEP